MRACDVRDRVYIIEKVNPFYPDRSPEYRLCLDQEAADDYREAHARCATEHVPMRARVARQIDFYVKDVHAYQRNESDDLYVRSA